MPCCNDEEHCPIEFYCHGETNDPANATFQGHVVKHGLDSLVKHGLDPISKTWTRLVKHGLD